MKECSMMLAAIEAMTQPDTIRLPCSDNADIAAQAAAVVLVHVASPYNDMILGSLQLVTSSHSTKRIYDITHRHNHQP